jgi:uncharacterized protein with PQ loop repeat
MGPSLNWERQFNEMVEKIKQVISKLRNTSIITLVAYVFYNIYLLTKVYFGYSIMNINNTREEYLMKLYEPTILKKLRFNIKFPCNVLYARKSILGIGLIKPSTAIQALALKQYIGHKWIDTKLAKTIDINKEIAHLQYGYSTSPIKTAITLKPSNTIWNDEVENILRKRKLQLININNEHLRLTVNNTIIDFVVKYIEEMKLKYNTIQSLNQMRIFKKMYLLYELVELDGNSITTTYTNEEECSGIM